MSVKGREWSIRSQSSYYGYSPVQGNVMGSPALVTVIAQTSRNQSPPAPGVSKRVIWYVSIALAPYSSFYLCSPPLSISLIPDLIALPPSPTSLSPAQASSPAPILSMAKLTMHRHVCIAFFRLPFVNLAHITSCFLIPIFSPMTPTLRIHLASSPPPIDHHSLSLSLNTTRCPISFVHGRSDQATR